MNDHYCETCNYAFQNHVDLKEHEYYRHSPWDLPQRKLRRDNGPSQAEVDAAVQSIQESAKGT